MIDSAAFADLFRDEADAQLRAQVIAQRHRRRKKRLE